MFVTFRGFTVHSNTPSVSLRCPSCRQLGVFEPLSGIPDAYIEPHQFCPPQPALAVNSLRLGQRRCPNRDCNTQVFCIVRQDGRLEKSYPVERLDFDATKIPAGIRKTFEEAISCHAEGCYVAAAIMVRRTLEELCQDKQATGNDLVKKIESLRSKVVLPDELFAAMHDLRLLGNDAAHIEAKTYNAIGKEELETAIDVTKEILKAVYQLDSLIERLRRHKKS